MKLKQPIPEPSRDAEEAIIRLECALKLQGLYFNDATMIVLESEFTDMQACARAIEFAVKMDEIRHELVQLRIAQNDW